MLVQLTTPDEWHDKVQLKVVLDDVVHANQEWTLALKQNGSLQLCALYLVSLNEDILSDALDGVQLVGVFKLSEQHLSERPFAKYALDLKAIKSQVLVHFLVLRVNHEGFPS